MMKPSRVVAGAAGLLAALALAVGSLTGAGAPAPSGPGVSLSSVGCAGPVLAGTETLAQLSDAVPADLGHRLCGLARSLQGDPSYAR